MNNFQVKLIGDKNAPLGESLGITPERWSELIPVLHAAFTMVCLTIGMVQAKETNPFEKLISILTR